MSALARTTEINCDTPAANEDCINGGSRTRTKYDYDGLGRRVSKTVNGLATSYLLDGDEEIAEYSGSTLLRRYVTGPGVDDRIAHVEGNAITNPPKSYYHTNHQGSVIDVTDGSGNVTACAGGIVCGRLSYDEYGNGTPLTGEQYGYTGRRFDPETQLYYYRARYYAPAAARFLQSDPVGYKDNLNLYTYTGNDPLDKTDPSGMFCIFGFGNTCAPAPPPTDADKAQKDNTPSIWSKLVGKVQSYFNTEELQKDKKPEEPATSTSDAALKKLKEAGKDKAKDLAKDVLKEAARKAGASDAQICEAEHCGTAGTKMSVCLMTYCGEELGLGGNDPAEEKK